jgi:hypothetical protein
MMPLEINMLRHREELLLGVNWKTLKETKRIASNRWRQMSEARRPASARNTKTPASSGEKND